MVKKVISPIWGVLDRQEQDDKYGFTQVIKREDSKSKKENKEEKKEPVGLEEFLFEE